VCSVGERLVNSSMQGDGALLMRMLVCGEQRDCSRNGRNQNGYLVVGNSDLYQLG